MDTSGAIKGRSIKAEKELKSRLLQLMLMDIKVISLDVRKNEEEFLI